MNEGTGPSGPNSGGRPGADMLRQQLAELRRVYANQLPVKLQQLRDTEQALLKDDSDSGELLDELHRQVHNLAGSGATYGFPTLSKTARGLEIYLKPYLATRDRPDTATMELISGHVARIAEIIEKGEEPSEETTAPSGSPPGDGSPDAGPAQIAPASATATTQDRQPQGPWNTGARRLLYYLAGEGSHANDIEGQISHFGYTTRIFHGTQDLLKALAEEPAYAVIVDMPSADEIEALQGLPDEGSPRIFIAEGGDVISRLQAVRAGSEAYFTLPVDIGELINKLDSFAVHDSPSPYRILIVDDEESLATYYSWVLQGAGMSTAVVNDPLEIMQTLIDFRPELILMDVYMPASTGMELATVIRQQEDYVSIPIVFLSAETDIDKQLAAMHLGGDDFLTKPIQADHLVSSVTARAQRSRTLRSFMIRDSLTGLLNHTTTKEQLNVEMLRAHRGGTALSFAMIDIDKFKNVNDTYGHLVGDRVIKSMARLLTQRLRKTDIIGRYGGEEFAVILADTPVEKAVKVLNEIREGFSKITHHTPEGEFAVTFSCGIAQYPDWDDAARLNDAADRALYEAKRSGRNRIVLAKDLDKTD